MFANLSVSKTRRLIAFGLPIFISLIGISLFFVVGGTQAFHPVRHAFLEYFGIYLGVGLFAICVRRYRLQQTNVYLFLSAGFMIFCLLQIVQIIAYPGFHDISWLPASQGYGEAFDSIGRFLLAGFLLFGALSIARTQDTVRGNILNLLLISALTFVTVTASIFAFLPPDLFETVPLSGLLSNLFPALLFSAAAVVFLRRNQQSLSYWFFIGTVLLIFSSLYHGMWQSQAATLFQFSHLFKIAAFTAFLFGFFMDQAQFLKVETELRSTLEKTREELSEKQQAQQELVQQLREQNKYLGVLKQCLEHAREGLLILDREKKITYANAAFKKTTGFTDQDLIGLEAAELVADRGEAVLRAVWETVEDGRNWHGEFYRRRKDRTTFIGEVAVVPISENGKAGQYLWSEKDITRRKKLEKSIQDYTEELTRKTHELETSKAYYKSLISGMSDILLVIDNEGQCTFINEYGVKRLRLRAEQLTRQNLPVFFDDLQRLEQDYGSTIQVEIKDFEAIIKTRDGKPILCSWYARPLFDRRGKRVGAMAVGRDITEYKQLQNELEEYAKNLEHKVEKRTRELRLKVDQLARLLEIGEEIRLNVDIDVILNKVGEAVQALGWRKVIISLRDENEGVSRPVATAGLPPEQIEQVMKWKNVPLENTERFFKEEFRISHSYYVPHNRGLMSKDAPFSVYSELGERKEDEWQALDVLLVPIRTRDKILGVISVDDPVDKKKPNLEKVRDLEIFADKAVLAMENARLFQMQKESERRAKFLAEMSQIFHSSLNLNEVLEAIVGKGGRAIGDFCCLLLLDESGEFLQPEAVYHKNPSYIDHFKKGVEKFPCKLGEGVIGGVASSGEPFMASAPFSANVDFARSPFCYMDRIQSISSLLIVPLRAGGRIIGTMVFLYAGANRKYKGDQLKLAVEVSDRAALAIENARLFKDAGEKALELEKANKMKSEFLANVSHELRTPLNAIITLADILIREFSDEAETEHVKQLRMIQRSGRNLLNLINDILDLSKIESGRMEPIYESVYIRALIQEIVESIRPLCSEKGLKLECHISEDVPENVYTDSEKLTKALTNLLSNAVKFTHKGKISVDVNMSDGNELVFEISDTGIGIPEERYQDIFEEFQQVESSDSRTFGGTGLGLAITRKVLDAIGGSVSVSSRLGKGSTFAVRLPQHSSEQQSFDFQRVLDDKNGGDASAAEQVATERTPSDSRKKPQPASDRKDKKSQSIWRILNIKNWLSLSNRKQREDDRARVLLVDDDQDTLYAINYILDGAGYNVFFVNEGSEAIRQVSSVKPDLILMDIMMPGMDGYETTRRLKAMEEYRDTPVVAMTAKAMKGDREKILQAGCDDYIAKPFLTEEILRMVEKWLHVRAN